MRPPIEPSFTNPKLRKAINDRAAEERLRMARQFVLGQNNGQLFQRRVNMNGRWVIVRLEWPCLLTVLDVKTGELLARSRLVNPVSLDPCFKAPDTQPEPENKQGGH